MSYVIGAYLILMPFFIYNLLKNMEFKEKNKYSGRILFVINIIFLVLSAASVIIQKTNAVNCNPVSSFSDNYIINNYYGILGMLLQIIVGISYIFLSMKTLGVFNNWSKKITYTIIFCFITDISLIIYLTKLVNIFDSYTIKPELLSIIDQAVAYIPSILFILILIYRNYKNKKHK